MRPSDALAHAGKRGSVQHYLGVIKTLSWDTFRAKVEFLDSPGLHAEGRIFTISGTWGTIYPPFDIGDVVLLEVTGSDLQQLMQQRAVHRITNPHLYDTSDVVVSLSGYMDFGEPAGRKATTPPVAGEWGLVHKTGARITFTPQGDIVAKPAATRKVYLGGTTNPKAVLVDGDSNAAGGVAASQSSVMAGT